MDPRTSAPTSLVPLVRLTLPIPRRSKEEEQLRSHLWKLEGAACSPGQLSRSARMVLLAARNQALRPRADTSTLEDHPELPAKNAGGPAVPGG